MALFEKNIAGNARHAAANKGNSGGSSFLTTVATRSTSKRSVVGRQFHADNSTAWNTGGDNESVVTATTVNTSTTISSASSAIPRNVSTAAKSLYSSSSTNSHGSNCLLDNSIHEDLNNSLTSLLSCNDDRLDSLMNALDMDESNTAAKDIIPATATTENKPQPCTFTDDGLDFLMSSLDAMDDKKSGKSSKGMTISVSSLARGSPRRRRISPML